MFCYPEDWPLLIGAPQNVREMWIDALRVWAPPHMTRRLVIVPVTSAQELPALTDVLQSGTAPCAQSAKRLVATVMTYDLVQKIPIADLRRFGCVVVDESHLLKDKDSLRCQRMKEVLKTCKRALLLSGKYHLEILVSALCFQRNKTIASLSWLFRNRWIKLYSTVLTSLC